MYKRISVIGGPGSGKSTLCNILSRKYDIPAVHLDAVYFRKNWIKIDKNERDKIILKKALEKEWIMDGDYVKTLNSRLKRTELVIWLDYSTYAMLKGVSKRYIKLRNRGKPELNGNKEKIPPKFLLKVATYNFRKRPQIIKELQCIPRDRILIFKKQKDLNKWLEKNDMHIKHQEKSFLYSYGII